MPVRTPVFEIAQSDVESSPVSPASPRMNLPSVWKLPEMDALTAKHPSRATSRPKADSSWVTLVIPGNSLRQIGLSQIPESLRASRGLPMTGYMPRQEHRPTRSQERYSESIRSFKALPVRRMGCLAPCRSLDSLQRVIQGSARILRDTAISSR